MISAADKANNINAAEHWFKQVEKVGLRHDVVTFNTLIHAAMKAARPSQVEELFWRMLEAKLEPDDVTLRTMRWSVGRQRLAELCRKAGVGWYGKDRAPSVAPPSLSTGDLSSSDGDGRFAKLVT